MHLRRGITLIEMLVATGVFLVGFVGVFGLFLAGVTFRKKSEDLTHTSLAISSLAEEIRINAGRESQGISVPPSDYVGDGFAIDALSTEDNNDLALFRYNLQPHIWYRVRSCTDMQGDATNANTTGLKIQLFVVPWATGEDSLTLGEIAKRLQLKDSENSQGALLATADAIAQRLIEKSIAMQSDIVILRHPNF